MVVGLSVISVTRGNFDPINFVTTNRISILKKTRTFSRVFRGLQVNSQKYVISMLTFSNIFFLTESMVA
jgi:hypothetical protein